MYGAKWNVYQVGKKVEARCSGQVHDQKPGNVEMGENPSGAGIYADDSH